MIFVVIVDEKHGVVWFRLVYSLDEFLIKDQATVIWEVSRNFPHTNYDIFVKKNWQRVCIFYWKKQKLIILL